MTCENIQQSLLDWNPEQRAEAAAALEHLKSCPQCRQALEDYDCIRQALAGDSNALPQGGWEAFDRRLTDALSRRRRWWLPVGSAIAATLLIAALGFHIGRATLAPQSVAVVPQLSEGEVKEQAAAFDQVADVFDRRTSWMLVSDRKSDVGLVEAPVARAERLLMLRLTLNRQGKTVSQADLAIIPSQTAELTLPLDARRQLKYRVATSASLPQQLSIWVELLDEEGRGQPIAALATQLEMQPGQGASAGRFVTGSAAYELTVAFAQAELAGGS